MSKPQKKANTNPNGKTKHVYRYGTLADLIRNYVADRATPFPDALVTRDAPPPAHSPSRKK